MRVLYFFSPRHIMFQFYFTGMQRMIRCIILNIIPQNFYIYINCYLCWYRSTLKNILNYLSLISCSFLRRCCLITWLGLYNWNQVEQEFKLTIILFFTLYLLFMLVLAIILFREIRFNIRIFKEHLPLTGVYHDIIIN